MSKRGDARAAARSLDALFGADKLGQSKPPRVGGRDRWADAPRQAERKAESKKSKKRQEQVKAAKASKKGKGGGRGRGLF